MKSLLVIGATLLFFGIGFFILHFMVGETVDKIVAIPAIQESQASVDAFEGINKTTDKLDYVVFSVYMALILAMLITSYFSSGHPIFMVVFVIVIILSVVIGALLANTWETATQTAVFQNTIQSFPITNNILLNLPLYNAVIGVLTLIVMFMKPVLMGKNDY